MTDTDGLPEQGKPSSGAGPEPDGRRYARRPAGHRETVAANRRWWDEHAAEYYAEHGDFLGDDDLVWGPERLRESQIRLLGDVAGLDVLEIGAGAAQGSRHLAGAGARVVATDVSAAMLAQSRAIDARLGRPAIPLVQCDATRLPFAAAGFDVVFSSYGAVPFIADSAGLMRECARVLRPGGRLVFSTSHPIRWAFPDTPGAAGLTVTHSYFDRTPYVEESGGLARYVEHHRTLGDRVRELTAAGLRLVDLLEPEWPETTWQTWGGWSPLRGGLIPGTAIFVARRDG